VLGGENEPEELGDLDCAGLIAKVEQLEKFLVQRTRHGFNNFVAHMKAVNLGIELMTAGIHYLKDVKSSIL
jgi:hypothetical protein